MSGTTVEYGGETIYGVLTLGCHQSIVRDSSNTDLMYHLFDLRFQGLMHTGSNTSIVGFSNQQTVLADGYKALRRKMMRDRQEFTWSIAGAVALKARPHPGGQTSLLDVDVQSGPKPQAFVVKGVRAGSTLEVEFSIQVAVIDCTQLDNSSGVLSNRWATIDHIDENWYTTRTVQGELVLVSPRVHVTGPHFFRQWVFPPLPNGFKRTKMDFTATPDGKKLLYTIEDRQVSNAPPKPATSWHGTHSVVSRNDQGGIGTTVEIQLTLVGPEGTDIKRGLFAAAAQVARDRIMFETAASAAILQEMRLIDVIEESRNEVQLSLRLFKPGSLISDLSVADLQTIGKPINVAGYNRFQCQIPKVYGTSTPVGVLAAHLQSGCGENHRFSDAGSPVGEGGSAGDNPAQSGVVVNTYEGIGEFNEESGPYKASHLEAPYSFYRIEGTYDTDHGRCVLPIAKTDDDDEEDTVVVARTHKPVCYWKVKVAGERVGRPPELPMAKDFEDGGIKYKILRSKVFPPPPEISADGEKPRHQAQVEYQYVLSRPPKDSEALRTGSLPWDNRSIDQNKLASSHFTDGIA